MNADKPTVFSIGVHPRSSGASKILSRLPACEDPVAGRRRALTGNLRVVGKALLVRSPIQGRIDPTTYEARHCPFPESVVATTGFALEGTTRCEKGLRENHKGTSPRREARTT